jgi:hypothetical protein
MELNKIERLVKKYFDGETSVEEEKELRKYFASTDVASHLMQYKSILDISLRRSTNKNLQRCQSCSIKRIKLWLSIAASVFVLLSAGMYVYVDRDVSRQDLGTCENPEEAMKETQRALAILSVMLMLA